MKSVKTINSRNVELNTLKKIFRISVVIFCLCFCVQFYLSNRFAVKNSALKGNIERSRELKKELARLEYRNSLLSSLPTIEEKATNLGFVEMEQQLLTIGPVTVASLNQ